MAFGKISFIPVMVLIIIAEISGKDVKPEFMCDEHEDCPSKKPTCVGSICMNLCELKNMCGINASCKLKENITPVCYCEDGLIGDPFVKCTEPDVDVKDCESQAECPGDDYQCISNKCVDPCIFCGENAICITDSEEEQTTCTCPSDMTGNPYDSCKSSKPSSFPNWQLNNLDR